MRHDRQVPLESGAPCAGGGERPLPGRLASWLPGALLVHPGSADRAGRWSPSRFAAVARLGAPFGHVAVLAGPDELDVALEVAARADLPTSHVFAAHANMLELAPIIAAGGRLVTAERGIARLARALATPAVLLSRLPGTDLPALGAGGVVVLVGPTVGEQPLVGAIRVAAVLRALRSLVPDERR